MASRAARSAALGRAAEETVAARYEAAGYAVLERNWRCSLGEIDLVCRRGRLLVLCEVKARSSDRFGTGLEAVRRDKVARLRRLGACYLAGCREPGLQVRFDVASLGPTGPPVVVEGAF